MNVSVHYDLFYHLLKFGGNPLDNHPFTGIQTKSTSDILYEQDIQCPLGSDFQ